jgi:hypothetical protein
VGVSDRKKRIESPLDRTHLDLGAFSTMRSRAGRASSSVRLRIVTIQSPISPSRPMPLRRRVAAEGGGANVMPARL